jgi:hypothetical protein
VSHSVGKEIQQGGTIDPLFQVRPVEQAGISASIQGFGNFRRREEKLIGQLFGEDFWPLQEAILSKIAMSWPGISIGILSKIFTICIS